MIFIAKTWNHQHLIREKERIYEFWKSVAKKLFYLLILESSPCKFILVYFQTVLSWRGKIINKLLERPNSIHIRHIWVTSNALFSSPTINLFPTFRFLYKTERLFYRCLNFIPWKVRSVYMQVMSIGVGEFSNGGHKIRNIFA